MKLEKTLSSMGDLTATGNIRPLITLITVLAFTACTGEEIIKNKLSGDELQINVTTAGYASIEPGTPETRATDNDYNTTFANGDQVGITALNSSNAILHNNIPYTYNGTTWAPTTATNKVELPPEAGIIYLVYYPYSATMNGKTTEQEIFDTFSVPADQGDQAKYTGADLMICTGSIPAGNTLTVTLTHRLALLEINLPPDASNAQVKIDGTEYTARPFTATAYRCIVKPATGVTLTGKYNNPAEYGWRQKNVALEAGKYTKVNLANGTVSTIDGYTGKLQVIYKNGTETNIHTDNIKTLTSVNTVKSITLTDKSKIHLIGRVVDNYDPIHLKFDTDGNLLLRDAVNGFIPIGSYAEFQKISGNGPNKKYRQEFDLDLMNEEWAPIANNGTSFSGEFDGTGKTLSNLKITQSGQNYQGLFRSNQGTIRNVHIASGTITAEGYSGGISGTNSSLIISCSNAATVSGSGTNIGGVAGSNQYGTITACYNTGTVSGSSYVGGVAGRGFSTTVIASYNTGAVSGSVDYVGGVVGFKTGTVTACYNNGVVSGPSGATVGGVVGHNYDGAVTACYWENSIVTKGIGDGSGSPTPFKLPAYFTPTGSNAWNTGTGGTNGYWKEGTTNGSQLPKLWFE
jgi:hypothetical protein